MSLHSSITKRLLVLFKIILEVSKIWHPTALSLLISFFFYTRYTFQEEFNSEAVVAYKYLLGTDCCRGAAMGDSSIAS